MCQVDIFNGGRSSSIADGLSKGCKQVLNKACAMPWCHAVVHFEVKVSRFTAVFQHHSPAVEAYLQSKGSFFHSDFQCVAQY